MAVLNAVTSAEFTGDGAQTEFAIPFRFLDEDHLVVTLTSPLDVAVTLILGDHYSVTGALAAAGVGLLTTVVGVPADYVLRIQRVTPRTQPAALREQGDFSAATHENALDRLEMQIQEIEAGVLVAVDVLAGETNTASNVGGGAEVYKQKVAADLQLRTLESSDGSVAIAQGASTLDLSVVGQDPRNSFFCDFFGSVADPDVGFTFSADGTGEVERLPFYEGGILHWKLPAGADAARFITGVLTSPQRLPTLEMAITIAAGGTDDVVRAGWISLNTAGVADAAVFAYFVYDAEVGFWVAKVGDGATIHSIDCDDFVMDGNQHVYKIVFGAAEITFYVDGVAVGNAATHPRADGPDPTVGLGVVIDQTRGAVDAAASCSADYVRATWTSPATRIP